ISATPFSEPSLTPVLEVQKLGATCACDWGNTQHAPLCQQKAFECVQQANIYDFYAVVALVNVPATENSFFWDANYAEVYENPNLAGFDEHVLAHEMLHYFNFCDTYNKNLYDQQSIWLENRKYFDTYLFRGCHNSYPLNWGVGPVNACNTICNPLNNGNCAAGVCGAHSDDGTTYPYNVDLMGNPFSTTSHQLLANPFRIFESDYQSMTYNILKFGFSLGGASSANLGSSQPTSTMEIRYIINRQNNTAVLKSARKVNSEVYIVPPEASNYTLEVYGRTNTVLLSKPVSALFADSRGNSLAETTLYQRIPWSSDAELILIKKGNEIIEDFDMRDTDNDSQVNEVDLDDDNDGFTDVIELYVGTSPTKACGADWPANMNNAGGSKNKIDVFDVNALGPPVFFSTIGSANYKKRYDLDASGKIDILDVNKLAPPVFFKTCTEN
ncbi:MAG TPA: thrombospondin type 3 repeat-containing protein, partial [Candidatus Nanoarchaeia archaeon]|nr:thrombospondin type 3 repeat-containing protein [Candidatus Nanoarchaeia archaeon]